MNSSFRAVVNMMNDGMGYYQDYFENTIEPWETNDEIIATLPQTQVLEQLSK